MLGKNVKTSVAGLALIMAALADLFHGFATDPSKIMWQADITGIFGGIGLLCAKDGNVTGGTVIQPTPPDVLKAKEEENVEAGVRR
jgi:hypothetical protein